MRYRILVLLCCLSTIPGWNQDRPNILFIAVDDLNDWVGYLSGHGNGMKIHTPNIDKLARRSLVFTNAHTPSPACAPARAAIMTGIHHARSGVANVHWGDGPKWRNIPLLKDAMTMEQFFKDRGYITLGAGKIYHSQAPPWTPTSQVEPENWDFYFPSAYISHPHQIRPPDDIIFPKNVDNERRPGGNGGWWTWGPIDAPDEKMADFHVVDWACYQLQHEHDRPFFLAVGLWKPHDPWEVPQKYFDLYPIETVKLPPSKTDDLADAFDHGRRWIHQWVLDNNEWQRVVQSYAAAITFSDAMVGHVLDALESSPYSHNTIICLWADHGMHMGEKDNIEKFTLWEASTRVPFILYDPRNTTPNTRCDAPVSLMDIYPTLCELTGFDVPDHLDGVSLMPQVKDQSIPHEAVLSSYRFSWTKKPVEGHALRDQRYRYIYYPDTGLEELYDHFVDPEEWNNIAYQTQHFKKIRDFRSLMKAKVPYLSWRDEIPKGYAVEAGGEIRRLDFKRLE